MSVPTNPHDALFRALLEDPQRAETLIREYLPKDIASLLSDQAIELVDGTFIDEEFRSSQSDRLFSVKLKNGNPAFIYTLLEHKSRPDPGTPLQLLGYKFNIWKRYAGRDAKKLRNLPPIIPLVFYHGKDAWNIPTSIFECINAGDDLKDYVRNFRYILHNLRPIPYIRLSSLPPLRAALGALKFAFDDGVGVEVLVSIVQDLPDDDPLERQVLYYIVRVYDATEDTLKEAVSLAKPDREDELMPTIAQEWVKQGRADGLKQGMAMGEARGKAEGKAEGKADTLLRQLRRRFKILPADIEVRVRAADIDLLDEWSDRFVDASELSDIFEAKPH